MSSVRFQSIDTALTRDAVKVPSSDSRISSYFGTNVFNKEAMQKYMSEEAYFSVRAAMESGKKIDRNVADQVAAAMKAWAIEKGAKSFSHWFQPLTGATAEKHDTFFEPNNKGGGLENFSGSALVQQEPDASSFPSGGIRQTFEARGYTAWDPSSPAFIMEIGDGRTLCIPTIFVSYTGEALDYKAPLLKSAHLLEQAALPVVNLFDRHATRVTATLGWEQEYFLVDEALFQARPDLAISGRTLVGHYPAKGQQLDDHYFGSIPERVYAFMLDLEQESHKLGIPVRTRHNEVAPSQFECAPMFEEVNVAVDHNQLLMDLMDRVARRHKMRVLLHEKPYAGINGSGKHNNWSMGTDTGKNLLSPGKTPRTNLLFLTFFINVIKAVNEHADLIRAAIASAGNDHRLGANEAPPAIISVFIGSNLTKVLEMIEKEVSKGSKDLDTEDLKLSIHNMIPDVLLDNTDRNRTSPFAFTGNKFEIRAAGSASNCASTMTVMNTIMAHQLQKFMEDLEKVAKKGGKKDKENAIWQVLKDYITKSKRVLFEGDNYSSEWEKEAKKRGLSNVKVTPHALDFFVSKSAKDVFVGNDIFSERELDARYEVLCENYALKIQIEARCIHDLAINHILPAAVNYQNRLLENVSHLKDLGFKSNMWRAQMELIDSISGHIQGLKGHADKMAESAQLANKHADASKKAKAYCDKVKPHFDSIRSHADELEQIVDDAKWPLPKYRELLFIR